MYLEFWQAFDTVPHQRPSRKLTNYGIRGNGLVSFMPGVMESGTSMFAYDTTFLE